MEAYFHLVHYLLSVLSSHYSPSLSCSFPLPYCLSLSSSFPLVLSAVIIPLFFEVSINSSPPPLTYECMVFFMCWGSNELAHSWCFSLWNSGQKNIVFQKKRASSASFLGRKRCTNLLFEQRWTQAEKVYILFKIIISELTLHYTINNPSFIQRLHKHSDAFR